MTNSERILSVVEQQSPGDGICDDCLSIVAEVHPRQQVYQICSRLVREGRIERESGVCSVRRDAVCAANNRGREKILSLVAKRSVQTSGIAPPKPINSTPDLVQQTSFFSDWSNAAKRWLDQIEKLSSFEPLSDRISRLRRDGRIPSDLSRKMQNLNAFRNQVVKDRKALDITEWNLAEKYLKETRTEWESLARLSAESK